MSLHTSRACAFLRRAVRLFTALAAAWLFVSCLAATGGTAAGGSALLFPDAAWVQCCIFAAVCLVPALFSRYAPPKMRTYSRSLYSVRLVCICIAGLMAAVWVFCVQASPAADALSVQTAASDLSGGHSYLFQPGEYMYIYPRRSGLVLLHLLLQQVNPNTTLPFQMLNVLCYMGILFLLGEIAGELDLGDRGCFATTVAGIAFLPLFFYTTFVYGTLPGLALSLLGLVFSLRFCREAKWYQAGIASLALFLAVMIAPDYLIFTLGLILFTLCGGLRGRRHCFLLAVGLMLSWALAELLPILLLEKWTGCSLRSGLAPLSGLASGLRTDSPRGPGWPGEYALNAYYAAQTDPKAQTLIALGSIKGTLLGYLRDPGSMLLFFAQKNATQWSDPLFQSLWLNLAGHRAASSAVPGWTEALLNSPGPAALIFAADLLQTLIYGGLVLWAWIPTNERRKPAEDLLAAVLLGSFVYRTFWEAGSQYNMPYFVLILPLALLGFRRLAALREDPDAKVLWQTRTGKLRFLTPVLLMILALVLSVVAAAR